MITSTTTLLTGTPTSTATSVRQRLPITHPQARGSALVALAGAMLLGLGLGYDARLTALACTGMLLGATLMLRLEWAAMLVVAVSVFDDYLAVVNPWATKGVAMVLIASWLVRRGWRRLHHGGRSPVLVVAGTFTLVLLTSAVLHNHGAAGAGVVLRYLGFLAVLAVLVDTMRGGLSPSRLARVYVWACTAASLCGIATFMTGSDRRAGGPIGDPNDFAFFLVAALPLAVVLRSTARRPWLYDVAAGIVLLAMALTLSRGALAGLAAMVAVGVVTRVISLRSLAIGTVVAGTMVAVVIGLVPNLVDTSLEQKVNVADTNVTERLDLWQSATTMTLDNPVLGLGPGSFALYHQDFQATLPADVRHDLDVAHNTYLEVSSELGLLGLSVWLVLLATAILSAWSTWGRSRDPLSGGVLMALTGLAVSSAFVTEQYILPLWLMMALAAVALQPPPCTSSMLCPEQ